MVPTQMFAISGQRCKEQADAYRADQTENHGGFQLFSQRKIQFTLTDFSNGTLNRSWIDKDILFSKNIEMSIRNLLYCQIGKEKSPQRVTLTS